MELLPNFALKAHMAIAPLRQEKNMNELISKKMAFGLSVVAFAYLLFSGLGKIQSLLQNKQTNRNTINVTSEGKVKAVPDTATVNLGVIAQAKTAIEAQNLNSAKINKIIDFVKEQGISRDDIATAQFNIYPIYNYKDGRNEIIGYESRQNIRVKVKGIDKSTQVFSKVLSGVTEAGANQIDGVSMDFDDPNELLKQAREEAIAKAKQKAQELAKNSGVKLGKILTITENNFSVPIPGPQYGMGGGGDTKSVSPNIEPGVSELTQSLSLVFEIK